MPRCTVLWANDKDKDKITLADCTTVASVKVKLAVLLPNVFGPHITLLSNAKDSAIVLDDTLSKMRGEAPKKCYMRIATPSHYPNLHDDEWHDILFFHAAVADDAPGVDVAVAHIKQQDATVPESTTRAHRICGQFMFKMICEVESLVDGTACVLRRALEHIVRAAAKCDVYPDVCTYADPATRWSLVHACAWHNRSAVISLVVGRTIDGGACKVKEQTGTYPAVESDDNVGVRANMVPPSADVATLDCFARTPVFVAAERNHVEVLRALVDTHEAEYARPDSLGRSPLAVSVQNGSIECVDFLLMKKAAVNPTVSAPQAPLVLAAKRKDHALVARLLDSAADLNSVDADGLTALHASAANNDVQCVTMLVTHDTCDVDPVTCTEFSQRTPLLSHLARQGESLNLELITALLDRKADVNRVDQQGGFPLLYAVAMHRSPPVTNALLCAHANVEHEYVNAQTVLFFACAGTSLATREPAKSLTQATDVDLVRVLLEAGANAAAHDVLGWTPLMFALQWPSCPSDVIFLLLDAQASANATSVCGDTSVLRLAITRNDVPVIRVLVAAKADVNAMDPHGGFPLLFATSGTQDGGEIVQILLEANACVNTAYYSHEPVHFAAAYGQARALRFLLARRADAACVDTRNVNPLMMACVSGNEDCVQLLLIAEACANATDDKQAAPLQIAANWGHENLCNVLLSANAFVDGDVKSGAASPKTLTPLLGALRMGHHAAALALLRTSTTTPPSVHVVDAKGRSPLHIALTCLTAPDVQVVRAMCELKSDVGAPSSDGPNALFLCAHRDVHDVVPILVEAAADVNARDSNARTVLFVAIARGSLPMVRALVDARADVSVGDMTGKPLLCVAASKNYRDGSMSRGVQEQPWATALSVDEECVGLESVAEDEYEEIVRALIDCDAEVNASDSRGNTPLMLATQRNYGGIVHVLLRCTDINVDAVNGRGESSPHCTALLRASSDGHAAICEALLHTAANVDQQDPLLGNTPLVLACQKNHVATVETLLSFKADPLVRNVKGMTAFAAGAAFPNIEHLLLHPPEVMPVVGPTEALGDKKAQLCARFFLWKRKKKTPDDTESTH